MIVVIVDSYNRLKKENRILLVKILFTLDCKVKVLLDVSEANHRKNDSYQY